MYSPLSSKNKNGEGWLSLSWTEYNSLRQSCSVNKVELSFALEFQKFCPLKGGVFFSSKRCPLPLRRGVRLEEALYVGSSEEITGTAVSRAQFGVRLREVSASGGSTVLCGMECWCGRDGRMISGGTDAFICRIDTEVSPSRAPLFLAPRFSCACYAG